MLTGLSILTDRNEYSRFEATRAVIRARVVPVPNIGLDDTVTVTLKRKGGQVMATADVVFSGDAPKGEIVEFDLRQVKDAAGIPLCVRGDYLVEAVQDGGPTASADIRIALLTVKEIRGSYCRGATLYSSEILRPVKQPVLVSGVKITNVSENTRPGVKNLTFTASSAQLSWGGGPAAVLDPAVRTEILLDSTGAYIEVEIDHFELPSADAAEALLLDKERMSDEAVRAEIDKAIDDAEHAILKVFLEPMRIATEPYFSAPEEGQWFDRKVPALAYYQSDYNLQALAWHLNLPVSRPIRIDKVQGFMGNTASLEVASGAYAVNRESGTVDILPYNSQYSYLWTWFVNQRFWGLREYIAEFWRYQGVAGIEELSGEVLKLIGYTAAVTVLAIAGQAYRGGFSSESTSKDGVSRSVSYTASASYGIYSATISEYKEWLKQNHKRIARLYRGVQMVTL
jgi:hypothetical protein